MSFPDTLTIANSVPADVDFTKTSDDSVKTVFTDDESVIGLPTTLTIMHNIAKPGVTGVDRHTVKYSLIAADDSSRLSVLPISITISKPRTLITEQQVLDGVTILKNFLTAANITKLLRGEN
jgi:hypothetical protein